MADPMTRDAMTRDEMIETLTSVQASCHACRWRDEVAALASVIAALRAPAVTGAAKLPPRPPMPEPDAVPGLPRYGVTWQGGKDEPLLTPMPDGYWTPWHLAAATPAAGAPPALVALVREWQEARKPATLSAPGEFLAETFQAAVRRMSAADEALAAYQLDGPAGDRR